MFGIWVFTSQGAPGSLVLKCGFLYWGEGGLPVDLASVWMLLGCFTLSISLPFACQGGRLTASGQWEC